MIRLDWRAFSKRVQILFVFAGCIVFPVTARADIGVLVERAQAGDLNAFLQIGARYLTGVALEEDPRRAYAWLSVASELGSEEAEEARDLIATRLKPGDLETAKTLIGAVYGIVGTLQPASSEPQLRRSERPVPLAPLTEDQMRALENTAADATSRTAAGSATGSSLSAPSPPRVPPPPPLTASLPPMSESIASPVRTSDPIPQNPREIVREIQSILTQQGYEPGGIDGVWGPRTAQSLEEFSRDRGLDIAQLSRVEQLKELRDATRGKSQ